MENGIIYIATGPQKYISEAVFSAKSFKKCCPDIPITIFTDNTSLRKDVFDSIKIISNDINPMKIKVKYLCETPYQKTIFLDSDTQVKDSIYELFDLLEDTDIALASFPKIDRSYIPAKVIDYEQPNLYNTGVIAYKNSPAQEMFFKRWLEVVMLQDSDTMWAGHFCDQYYFNKLVAEREHEKHGTKIQLISNKIYNVRPPMIAPLTKSGEIKNSKIIHCHNLHRTSLERYSLRILNRLRREKNKLFDTSKMEF